MSDPTFFAPHLSLKNVATAIAFYQKAFGALELRRWSNPDGTVHVAELSLAGNLFHLHEESPHAHQLSPETLHATTCLIGLFTPDPDTLCASALATGATLIHPPQDYDYGYRQAILADPFGHQWLFQKRI